MQEGTTDHLITFIVLLQLGKIFHAIMILFEVGEVDPGLLTTAFDEKFNQFEEEEVCEADSKPVEELLLFQVSQKWSNLFLDSVSSPEFIVQLHDRLDGGEEDIVHHQVD